MPNFTAGGGNKPMHHRPLQGSLSCFTHHAPSSDAPLPPPRITITLHAPGSLLSCTTAPSKDLCHATRTRPPPLMAREHTDPPHYFSSHVFNREHDTLVYRKYRLSSALSLSLSHTRGLPQVTYQPCIASRCKWPIPCDPPTIWCHLLQMAHLM